MLVKFMDLMLIPIVPWDSSKTVNLKPVKVFMGNSSCHYLMVSLELVTFELLRILYWRVIIQFLFASITVFAMKFWTKIRTSTMKLSSKLQETMWLGSFKRLLWKTSCPYSLVQSTIEWLANTKGIRAISTQIFQQNFQQPPTD